MVFTHKSDFSPSRCPSTLTKKRGRARKVPHWLRLYSGAFKKRKKEKSKMSPTFSEKIQKANASGPNVFTETASLRCVFGHNLPFAGVAEQLWPRLHGGCREHEAEGLSRLDLCACMEEWAGRRTSLFLLDRRCLTHTGTFCPSISPFHRRRFYFIISSREIFIQRIMGL